MKRFLLLVFALVLPSNSLFAGDCYVLEVTPLEPDIIASLDDEVSVAQVSRMMKTFDRDVLRHPFRLKMAIRSGTEFTITSALSDDLGENGLQISREQMSHLPSCKSLGDIQDTLKAVTYFVATGATICTGFSVAGPAGPFFTAAAGVLVTATGVVAGGIFLIDNAKCELEDGQTFKNYSKYKWCKDLEESTDMKCKVPQ